MANHVLYHIRDIKEAILELRRVLSRLAASLWRPVLPTALKT